MVGVSLGKHRNLDSCVQFGINAKAVVVTVKPEIIKTMEVTAKIFTIMFWVFFLINTKILTYLHNNNYVQIQTNIFVETRN